MTIVIVKYNTSLPTGQGEEINAKDSCTQQFDAGQKDTLNTNNDRVRSIFTFLSCFVSFPRLCTRLKLLFGSKEHEKG